MVMLCRRCQERLPPYAYIVLSAYHVQGQGNCEDQIHLVFQQTLRMAAVIASRPSLSMFILQTADLAALRNWSPDTPAVFHLTSIFVYFRNDILGY